MKKIRTAIVLLLVCVMAFSINVTAFAATETNEFLESSIVESENKEVFSTQSSVVSVFEYSSGSFYIENNQGKFSPDFSSSDARIVVAAKRADNTQDGTITVIVYKKNLLGKTKVMSYTCPADGKGHTSDSFSITKNANYVVDITTSTAHKSVVSVNIAAVKK